MRPLDCCSRYILPISHITCLHHKAFEEVDQELHFIVQTADRSHFAVLAQFSPTHHIWLVTEEAKMQQFTFLTISLKGEMICDLFWLCTSKIINIISQMRSICHSMGLTFTMTLKKTNSKHFSNSIKWPF